MKIVPLDEDKDFYASNPMVSMEFIAMSSTSLAVGSPSGRIKLFNRKDLCQENVFSLPHCNQL